MDSETQVAAAQCSHKCKALIADKQTNQKRCKNLDGSKTQRSERRCLQGRYNRMGVTTLKEQAR